MTANAGNLNIVSNYSGITIGYNAAYNFKFNLDLQHASLKDNGNLEFSKKNIESTKKYYSGHYGSSSTSNQMTIKSEYGSINLKKIN
jgi:hypothetical protein